METKVCTECKCEKSTDEFSNCSWVNPKGERVYKLRGTCKQCRKIYTSLYFQNNREKFKETGKKYREDNKETISKYNRKYREDNKEKVKETGKKYREDNSEKLKQYDRKRREENIGMYNDITRGRAFKKCANLDDSYVKMILLTKGFSKEHLQAMPELIDFKRFQLKLNRYVKQNKNQTV